MAYIAKADVATLLNITLTPQGETLVDALIPAVEAYAESYCNRKWGNQANLTEYFDGGQRLYFVSNPPITTLTSIAIDGVTLLSPYYYNYGSYIRLADAASVGYRNVVITYTSNQGVPNDLKHALIRWVAQIFKAAEDGGKVGKRVQIGTVEIDYLVTSEIPEFVQKVLDRYQLPIL